jgi:hypothetical protein
MPAKKTDEPVDDAEETGDGETKPELARSQVWEGSGGTRLVSRLIPANSADDEAMVVYQTEDSDENGPIEKTVTVAEFEKWGKRCLGTVG